MLRHDVPLYFVVPLKPDMDKRTHPYFGLSFHEKGTIYFVGLDGCMEGFNAGPSFLGPAKKKKSHLQISCDSSDG